MFTPTLVSPSKCVQYCFNDLAIKRWNMILICTTFISDLIHCSILFHFIIGTINLCQNFIHHECKKTPPMGWNPFEDCFSVSLKEYSIFHYQNFFKIGLISFLFVEILTTMLSFLEDWFFSSKMCGMEMVSDMRMSDMGIKDYIYLYETTYINPQRGNDFLWS